MAATSKPTPRQIEEILQLYAAGVGRNKIAEIVGVKWVTTSRVINERAGTPLEQDAKLQMMTQVAKTKNAERRARLASRMLEVAEGFVEDTQGEALAFAFSGREGTYHEHLLPKPAASDVRNLIQSAGIAVRSSIELDKHDGNTAGEEKSLLSEIGRALGLPGPLHGDETP